MDPSYKQTLSPGAVLATTLTHVTPDADAATAAAGDLAAARTQITEPGQYLLYSDGEAIRTLQLAREWTRVGRSMAADVRFDDPTVSRRHALIVRQPDGVRVLDDRSLNGVFVNGERVEWRALADGDEIVVGRYRLQFADLRIDADDAAEPAASGLHEA